MKLTVIIAATFISLSSVAQSNNLIAFNNTNPATTQPVVSNRISQNTGVSSLVDFGGIKGSNKVDLKWITSNEKNISHFQVEKSQDGVNFSAACVVFAFGNTTDNKTYSFSDRTSMKGAAVYYRLRSFDNDGKTQVSEMIRVTKDSHDLPTVPAQVKTQTIVDAPAA